MENAKRISADSAGSVRFMLRQAPTALRLIYGLWMLAAFLCAVAGVALMVMETVWAGAGLFLLGLFIIFSLVRYAVSFVTAFSLRDATFRRHATHAGALRGPEPAESGHQRRK